MQVSVDNVVKSSATRELTPAFYHWDLETDQITWFGADAYFLDNFANTGLAFTSQISKEDRRQRQRNINQLCDKKVSVSLKYHMNLFSNQQLWVQEKSSVDVVENGQIKSIIGQVNFLSSPEQHHIAKRAFFQERSRQSDSNLKRIIRKAHEYNLSIESSYGYLVLMFSEGVSEDSAPSTEFIKTVMGTIRSCIRSTDTVHKVSNLSWLVLFDACSKTELEYYNQLIKSSIAKLKSQRDYNTAWQILTPAQQTQTEQLKALRKDWQYLKFQIDKLMITKSTVVDVSSYSKDALQGIREIEKALSEKRLCLAFQPIVNAQSLKPAYYECLARIINNDGLILSAGSFLNFCESTGLIKEVDIYVLQLVLAELLRDRKLRLSVNVSAITATDNRWLELLSTYVKAWPHIASRLVIELTETAIFFDLQESLRFMERLHSLGCKVAIDDFGAGYLSFSHLNSALANVVKIDGSIIQDLKNSNDSILMVRTLLSLIRPHGISCVAEFVEDMETINILRQEGVEYLQGYYTGKGLIARP